MGGPGSGPHKGRMEAIGKQTQKALTSTADAGTLTRRALASGQKSGDAHYAAADAHEKAADNHHELSKLHEEVGNVSKAAQHQAKSDYHSSMQSKHLDLAQGKKLSATEMHYMK